MRSTALKAAALCSLLIAGAAHSVKAQERINIVTTAVPFLRISPDARAGGMGDLGVATSADAASSFFNLGKVPFNTQRAGVNVTYTPWLKNLVNDVYMASASAFYKLDDLQAISGSLRYFSLGNIQFTDQLGNSLGSNTPREFGIDFGYSRRLSDQIGLGVGIKYINSALATGPAAGGGNYKAGSAVAADLGFYYNNTDELGDGWAFGAALQNLGSKIGYTDNTDQRDFIPSNLGLGTFYTKVIDETNKISFGVDVNKLLVPTPPAVTGDPAVDNAAYTAYRRKSTVSSWVSSFGDAPGGMSEELREFSASLGAEYMYNNQFAVRAGYFYEDKTKGNRRYLTAGVGVKYNVFGLNFSYLLPTGSGVNQNPLSNTLRFSLVFDLDGEAAE
ncbi:MULTISPECIES: type IX secretion system outer membrane channel protein PorV [Chitinophagaceae]|uniref:type IX secretion system outer membrane channel protein PorV n=1 Tax=Chitinophagaceae TaxID=563835 RepID=UPI000DEFA633|nr:MULTISPECIES: type IX secretion system outer membrane channel protein PorV [Chitinophagaceae]RPD46511.1 type IX secretion system outer membrane channel protein PorV [Paracnuella aquatica]